MKKNVGLGVALAVGAVMGAGMAIAAGQPVVEGFYGHLRGIPVYKVALPASGGLYVDGCPSGQAIHHTTMANGGHVIMCQ